MQGVTEVKVQVGNTANHHIITSIENIIGTNQSDTITGNDGKNILVGMDGSDTISGIAGNNIIYGGTKERNSTSTAADTIYRWYRRWHYLWSSWSWWFKRWT